MIEEWTLTKILNRVEILPFEKTYKYNRMNSINSKPALQKGADTLDEYKVKLQLHVQFCNPGKIIEMIEQKANDAQPVEWVYNSEYKGVFVIEKLEKSLTYFKDLIIYAELNFNLIEVATEKEFSEQKVQEVDLEEFEQFEEESDKIKEFSKSIKTSIVENLKTTIKTGVLSPNLADAVQEIASTTALGVLNDVAQGSIVDIYSSVSNYKDIILNNSPVSFDDAKAVAEAVSKIPELMMNSSLRGVK